MSDEREQRRNEAIAANVIRKAMSILDGMPVMAFEIQDRVLSAMVLLDMAHTDLTGMDWRTTTISD